MPIRLPDDLIVPYISCKGAVFETIHPNCQVAGIGRCLRDNLMKRSFFAVFCSLLFLQLFCRSAFAQQVDFSITTPDISNFPVIRTAVSVTENGAPALNTDPSNFKILDNGLPVSNVQLVGCDDDGAASIAVMIDTSASMFFSVIDKGMPYYYEAFSRFLSILKAPSELAIIPFGDTTKHFLPGNINALYQAENKIDTTAFMADVRSLDRSNWSGLTDPDLAVYYAIDLLKQTKQKRKAIVFVSDDAPRIADSMLKVLLKEGISFYALKVDDEFVYTSDTFATATGGLYFQAPNYNYYIPGMEAIARAIVGRKCALQYTSADPCPWNKQHNVSVTLNLDASTITKTMSYKLGKNTTDKNPPIITVTSPASNSRRVEAADPYPCESGLRSMRDSILVNFGKLRSIGRYPDSSYDSLVVTNILTDARAVYVAYDSSGNRSVQEIIYHPPGDTLKPEILTPVKTGTQYLFNVQEIRKWDRGLKSIALLPGSTNFLLDNVTYSNSKVARVTMHIVNAALPANACLEAIDSVGNDSVYCISWAGEGGDTLTPLISQDPMQEPFVLMTGKVTEKRAKDLGLKQVIVTPGSNTSVPRVIYTDKTFAKVQATIVDSLFDAVAYVDATDSVGNRQSDSIVYKTTPDTKAPQCTTSFVVPMSYLVSATELQAWDRGIKSIRAVTTPVNMNVAAPVFVDRWHASILCSQINTTAAASVVIRAEDSAGNYQDATIKIDPNLPTPLQPLTVSAPLNFGTTYTPSTTHRLVVVSNPNATDVTITKVRSSGDNTIFSQDDPLSITIPAGGTQNLSFGFMPTLLGDWKANYTFSNDTMDLVTVTTVGRSIGTVNVAFDTVQVQKAGDAGELHMYIGAAPRPINLDTLSFRVLFGNNEIEAGNAELSCNGFSDSNALCNYQMEWNVGQDGNANFRLIRKDTKQIAALSIDSLALRIPFKTYVSTSAMRAITIDNQFVSQYSDLSSNPGLITIGSICPDSTIRAAMNGRLREHVEAITPNPVSRIASVDIAAESSSIAEIGVIDLLGKEQYHRTAPLVAGANTVTLDLSSLAQGMYIVRVVADRTVESHTIQVRR